MPFAAHICDTRNVRRKIYQLMTRTISKSRFLENVMNRLRKMKVIVIVNLVAISVVTFSGDTRSHTSLLFLSTTNRNILLLLKRKRKATIIHDGDELLNFFNDLFYMPRAATFFNIEFPANVSENSPLAIFVRKLNFK